MTNCQREYRVHTKRMKRNIEKKHENHRKDFIHVPESFISPTLKYHSNP